jgi:signal peptidase II
MTYLKRLVLVATILVSCVGCDQVTKEAAKTRLIPSQVNFYYHDIFRLHYMENTGAFLSLGAALPAEIRFWLLIVLTGIAVFGMLVLVLMHRGLRPASVMGLSLIIGGGIGNLIDRIFNNGTVIDFMNIGFGRLRTGIFNIADVAITAGALTLIVFGARSGDLSHICIKGRSHEI